MNSYIATFHTHFSAQCTARAMMKAGINAKMAPVPRTLSTDCGTCVRYEAATPLSELMHADYDAIYAVKDGSYRELQKTKNKEKSCRFCGRQPFFIQLLPISSLRVSQRSIAESKSPCFSSMRAQSSCRRW